MTDDHLTSRDNRQVGDTRYLMCPKCGEEMTWGSDGWYCEGCGNFVEATTDG